MNIDLLTKIKEYIEKAEYEREGEWGSGESISTIINNKEMPDLYYEICDLIDQIKV